MLCILHSKIFTGDAMQSVVGIFTSCAAADRAVREMLDKGIPPQSLIFLTSEQLPAQVEQVPTTDAEAHGMGKAIGAFVGGVVGASAGLGLGGAVARQEIGDRSEDAMDQGVPRDDVLLCRELLKRRRTLVIANLQADDMAETARTIMQQNGAENIDEARKEIRKAA